MAKKHLPIPLALMEIESAEIEYKFGSFVSLTDSDFRVVIISGMKEAILFMATDSAQRILLHPPLAGKDRKKAKGCCDKNCSGCEIPLRSSATLGHFAGKRIRRRLKKKKWAEKFFGDDCISALDQAGIQAYNPNVNFNHSLITT
ncbi:MAG: hypothetical protein AAFY98_06425 [Verrucomicrobiota bacterium]